MMVTTISYLVLILLSLSATVNGQTCHGMSQYSPCSSNGECGCLQYSFNNNYGICGILTSSCSQFVPCQAPFDACSQGHVCVRHTRCDSRSLCYPMSLGQRCPSMIVMTTAAPIIISNYSGVLTINDGIFLRPDGSSYDYYYEEIQIIVDKTGTYDITSLSGIDTRGYLYNGTFYPSSPSVNLIKGDDDGAGNGQFRLPVYLQAGVPYTLVVTTHGARITGNFSVIATGPGHVHFIPLDPIVVTQEPITTEPPIIYSYHSNALTNDSETLPNTNKFYQAIEVRVNTPGTYTLRCSSGIDTFGYLYQGTFYPSSLTTNVIAQNDDAFGTNDFGFTVNLQPGITYVLVVTTYREGETTDFTINASGPGDVYFNAINTNI